MIDKMLCVKPNCDPRKSAGTELEFYLSELREYIHNINPKYVLQFCVAKIFVLNFAFKVSFN